jgi:WD40 repeat protein
MRYGAILADDDPSLGSIGHHYTSALFSPDGGYTAASHTDGMVRIWDVRTGQLMRRVKADMGFLGSLVFMPDGKGFVSGCWDQKLRYWNINASRLRERPLPRNDFQGHVSGVDKPTHEREFSGHTV